MHIETWEAGPGSYNVSNNLTIMSQVYPNPPRPFISKGKRNPSMFISNAQSKEWLCTSSPASNAYSPNTTLLYKSASVVRFGNEKRKDHFLAGKDRSPGPIYSFPAVSARSTSFGKGGKGWVHTNEAPSPAAYNPKNVQTRLPVKMKGYLSEKIYAKNYEKYYKGQIGPGPAGYSPITSSARSICMPKAERLPIGESYLEKSCSPGPGAYGEILKTEVKKSPQRGGFKKNLDIRSCKS